MLSSRGLVGILMVGIAGGLCLGRAHAAERLRIVCLGDSITDGHTYPLLVEQALREAKQTPPIFLNAGIGGDTALGMRKRLEADVIARRPDLVLLSAGVNDILQGKQLEDYLTSVNDIADELARHKIKLLVLTITPLRDAQRQKQVDAWNAGLLRLAGERKLPVADVASACAASSESGEEILEQDGVHLSFAGYRAFARGVLDALGKRDVPVPLRAKIALEPGAITAWRVRSLAKDPAGEFSDYALPESQPHKAWWFDQERQRGFAVHLSQRFGPGRVEAVAIVPAPEARRAYLLPGANVQTIWLNGEKVYDVPAIHGWHIGPAVEVSLQTGENKIVLQAEGAFFLALRDAAP